MVNRIKHIAMTLVLLLLANIASAQDMTTNSPVEMADGLYQSGKIYVVVVVLSVIMAGILAYLIFLDRKISKLEKEVNK